MTNKNLTYPEVILYIYEDLKLLWKRLYWRFAIKKYPKRMQNYFHAITRLQRGEGV